MKKPYQKPVVAVELFQLDASIAASCSSQGYQPLNHYDFSVCKDHTDNGYFFNANHCVIDLTPPDDDGSDGICYHGPIAGVTFIYS